MKKHVYRVSTVIVRPRDTLYLFKISLILGFVTFDKDSLKLSLPSVTGTLNIMWYTTTLNGTAFCF